MVVQRGGGALTTARFFAAAVVTWMSVFGLWACDSDGIPAGPIEARCRKLCEASKACVSPEEARRINCFTSCEDLDDVSRANDCYREIDDFYDCVDRHGVCADLDLKCAEQQDVFSDCLAVQCSSNPDTDLCLE
jgi:hypothetical protein